MEDPTLWLGAALTLLAIIALGGTMALKAFSAWIDLKRAELGAFAQPSATPTTATRIDLADMKERIRKLEAIAAGVDL